MTTLRALFANILAPGTAMTYRQDREGRRVSLFGYGAMRMPTVDGGHANAWAKDGYSKSAIDQEELNRQIRRLLDGGCNFFDTAPAYCRGDSEACLGRALKASGYDRGSYLLSSKLSNFSPKQHSFEESKALYEKSLRSLQTDYLDIYLLHSIGGDGMKGFNARFVDNGMMDFLQKEKAAGRIRNLGFSFHGDRKCFDWMMAAHDSGRFRSDVALIQMNYVDWRHAADVNKRNQNAEYLYGELARRGIRVMIMEPLLGGRLAQPSPEVMKELVGLDPEATAAKWAFRFCGSHPGVMTVLSGVTRREHIEENLATFSPLKPLSEAEHLAMERAAQAFLGLGAIPCNLCNYCMPCPYGLDIPGLFSFMNEVRAKRLTDRREIRALYERSVPDQRRRADRCIGCSRCRAHCPQSIDIPRELDRIAAFVEEYA